MTKKIKIIAKNTEIEVTIELNVRVNMPGQNRLTTSEIDSQFDYVVDNTMESLQKKFHSRKIRFVK